VIQILCGRDIANTTTSFPSSSPSSSSSSSSGDGLLSDEKKKIFEFAAQMRNYVYVIVVDNEAVLIDPCWDVSGLIKELKERFGVKKVGKALFTHRHFDHTGGLLPRFMTGGRSGVRVEGVKEISSDYGIKVYIGEKDVMAVARQSGMKESEIVALKEGMCVPVGKMFHIEIIETPGHTPGSCCFRLVHKKASSDGGILFTGDTLFIGACGRSDLPESDPRHLLHSLTRLSKLPKDDIVLPGHNYAPVNRSTIGNEVNTNTMIHQALRFSKNKTNLTRSKTSSCEQYDLPNYVETCRKVFGKFKSLHCCQDGHKSNNNRSNHNIPLASSFPPKL